MNHLMVHVDSHHLERKKKKKEKKKVELLFE